jgi:hypothetical protein
MANEVGSIGHAGASTAVKGLVSARPLTPRVSTYDPYADAQARRQTKAEQMQIILNTMGQPTGQLVNLVA